MNQNYNHVNTSTFFKAQQKIKTWSDMYFKVKYLIDIISNHTF